jgi:hypothetical protein
MSGASHGVASISSTPSFFNSSAIAPKIVCAFFSLSRISNAHRAQIGAEVKKIFRRDLADHDALLHAALVNAEIILESWPTLSQTMSSTSGASAGSVSPSNATATMRWTPAARASRANSSGSERLPAMRPSDSGASVHFILRGQDNSQAAL